MLRMKNIIKEGNKNLEAISNEVKLPLSQTDKKTLNQMAQFIIDSQDPEISEKYNLRGAVGLSAPQINILKRMFAIDVVDVDGIHYQLALINPIITSHSNELVYLPSGEGCLSVDRETEGITPRYSSLTFEAHMLDIPTQNVIPIKMTLAGYVAIVFQHEYDHLNGILFTTKVFAELPNAKPVFEVEEETSPK